MAYGAMIVLFRVLRSLCPFPPSVSFAAFCIDCPPRQPSYLASFTDNVSMWCDTKQKDKRLSPLRFPHYSRRLLTSSDFGATGVTIPEVLTMASVLLHPNAGARTMATFHECPPLGLVPAQRRKAAGKSSLRKSNRDIGVPVWNVKSDDRKRASGEVTNCYRSGENEINSYRLDQSFSLDMVFPATIRTRCNNVT